ncbi:hypothetical protein EXIGLDRAFT_749759 [Exidia glandulosa HHB12029]|uniref:F-box domain-containing protein n=1 Tax=Exidia glandulosa HHB12029 TaxID=1314781 RepID=A0A165HPX8_EXIGL|nr:hypothetical protein EXIGLDRAFT_749759 [Exidia glandulosa HHB12029]
MFSDSEDEYEPDTGRYLGPIQTPVPPLRLLQDKEYRAKNATYEAVTRDAIHTDETDNDLTERLQALRTEKEKMHAYCEEMPWSEHYNWRHVRVSRFFLEMTGYHTGDLDLTGRTQTRYQKLRQRWTLLLNDLESLVMNASPDPVIEAEQWNAFRNRWKISRILRFGEFVMLIGRCLHVMDGTGPVYQKLFLADLPPEIIGYICDAAAPSDARSLSATSRYIRHSSLKNVFYTRRVLVAFPANIPPLEEDAQSQKNTLVQAISTALADMDFLLSRPDILRRVRDLRVENDWYPRRTESGLLVLQDGVINSRMPEFAPFYARLCDLLTHITPRSMSLHDIYIGPQLAAQLASQQHLRDLCVDYSSAPSTDFPLWLSRSLLHTATPSITNLGMTLNDTTNDTTSWHILALCPTLRQLFVTGESAYNGFLPPESTLWPHLTAVHTIERLHLQRTYHNTWQLSEWFEYAASRGSFKMTHVKIASGYGMSDQGLIRVLRALRAGNAPLRVLVLEGLAQGSTGLLDVISELFPALEGLTLIRRQGDRQVVTKSSRWPHAMHEYAFHMRGLSRLRFFAVNFPLEYFDVSPVDFDVVRVYQPPPEEVRWPITVDDLEGPPEPYEMFDAYTVALPFAAYCPSLEIFAITTWVPIWKCDVTRSVAGGIYLKEKCIGPKKGYKIGDTYAHAEWDPPNARTWE